MSDEEIRMRCLELAASLIEGDTTIEGMKEVAKDLFIYVRGGQTAGWGQGQQAQINWEKINPDRV